MKKFEFTGETKTISLFFRTATLHRIRAVAEFGLVKIGDLGGWIEKEENLSHEGKAWVCGDAKVWGNAKVCVLYVATWKPLHLQPITSAMNG